MTAPTNKGKRITEAQCDMLVEAYRAWDRTPIQERVPGSGGGSKSGPGHAYAARMAGVNIKSAVRAWEGGLPPYLPRPVSLILSEEKTAARARIWEEEQRRSQLAQQEREAAARQAIEARAEEGRMVGLARGTATNAIAMTGHLAIGLLPLAEEVRRQLQQMLLAAQTGGAPIDIPKTIQLMKDFSLVHIRVNAAAAEAMKMERLHLGKPTEVLGLEEAENLTVEEMLAHVENIAEVIRNDVAQGAGQAAAGPPPRAGQVLGLGPGAPPPAPEDRH